MRYVAREGVLGIIALRLLTIPALAAVTHPDLPFLGKGIPAASQEWSIQDRENDEGPGRQIEIRQDGKRVAAFVYGEGQIKPYMAIYDSEERRISNPGITKEGAERGRYMHHRGIFIGWNQITSTLGSDDLWHLRRGESMVVANIESTTTTPAGADLDVTIQWFSRRRNDDGDGLGGLLITERRRFHVARANGRTWVDQRSELLAARDLQLQGDLHHAGLHFRADADVDRAKSQTRYLWSPADLPPGNGRIVSDPLQWVHFRFPLHKSWYSVTQINHPGNRFTELSWRDYGRFGFFLTDTLQAGQARVRRHALYIR
jgi:hypothetical protein